MAETRLLVDSRKGRTYLVGSGNDLHCNEGQVKSKDIDSAAPGDIIHSNKGIEFRVLCPDTLDFLKKAKRGPQAVTLKDAGLIAAYTCISSGSKVVEAGTGNGILSMYLAHIVAPQALTTYELREDFAEIAAGNFKRFGFENIVLKNQSIYDGIEEKGVDAVVLDLPEPWMALSQIDEALRVGGRIASYSPSVNQVNKFNEALSENYSAETFEAILRHWKPKTMRPDTRMIGHTGFLTIARKIG